MPTLQHAVTLDLTDLYTPLLSEARRLCKALFTRLSSALASPEDLVQEVFLRLLRLLRQGRTIQNPLAFARQVLKREALRLYDRATLHETGRSARAAKRDPAPTAQPTRRPEASAPTCVEQLAAPVRAAVEIPVADWEKVRDAVRWPAERGPDRWALLLLQVRLLALDRAITLRDREERHLTDATLLAHLKAALPWRREEEERCLQPGWPPLGELWPRLAEALLRAPTPSSAARVRALACFAPRGQLTANQWHQWLSRARKEARTRLHADVWRLLQRRSWVEERRTA